MKGIWWEVWGVDVGENPPPQLLCKIPDELDGKQAAEEVAKETKDILMKSGVTEIEIRRVDEG